MGQSNKWEKKKKKSLVTDFHIMSQNILLANVLHDLIKLVNIQRLIMKLSLWPL